MITTLLLSLALNLLPNPYGREHLSLDGEWQAIVDQYDVGMNRPLYLDRKPQGKTEFIEASWEGGLTLQVPGDWNHQQAELSRYEGTLWYARHFDFSPTPGKRHILRICRKRRQQTFFLGPDRGPREKRNRIFLETNIFRSHIYRENSGSFKLLPVY